jgi:Tol biopolymer transport system component
METTKLRGWIWALLGGLFCAAQAAGQTTVRVSVSSAGAEGNAQTNGPAFSANGRFVVFQGDASTLVAGDGNAAGDAFLRDRDPDLDGIYDEANATTQLVSVSSSGLQGAVGLNSGTPSISADGRYIAFWSQAPLTTCSFCSSSIYLRDRVLGTTVRISATPAIVDGDSDSYDPDISADGDHVAFWSYAGNLTPNSSYGTPDVYVRHISAGTIELLSVDPGGANANGPCYNPSISADASYVAFDGSASNLVAGDTNGFPDVFVRSLGAGVTTRVSVSTAGAQGNGSSSLPAISDSGRHVAFNSWASNLVVGDTNAFVDVFVHDRDPDGNGIFDEGNGTTTRVSASAAGVEGNLGAAGRPELSPEGRYVSFWSDSTNLVPGDANGITDVFVKELQTGAVAIASVTTAGVQGDWVSGWPGRTALSTNASHVGFQSLATNLVGGDTNGYSDVFVRGTGLDTLPATYCTAKTNSLGCVPAIASSGAPSASAGSGFLVRGLNVRNNKPGLLFYGVSGQLAAPFQGGTLCVAPQVKRTPAVVSGGNALPANDCSGVYQIDFNAFAAGSLGGTPLASLQVAGTAVDTQWWGRDPGFAAPNNTTLTNALHFLVGP